MKRRNFLQLLAAGAAITATRLPWLTAATPSLDEIDHNYWVLQQRIRQLVTRGYHVGNLTMDPEEGGFRFSSVRVNDQPPLTWYQPWALITHQRENIHYDFRTCDCGAKTFTPHYWRCVRATHLAHHLQGDWSRFRKTDPDVEIDHLCETEDLHSAWMRYPVLLSSWYVVKGKADFQLGYETRRLPTIPKAEASF